jgi:putative membrane protein
MTSIARDSAFSRWIIALLSIVVLAAVPVVMYLVPSEGHADGPTPLATLNAVLNGGAALLLAVGFYFIKRRNMLAHRRCMLGAFALSSLFLISYLLHHAQVGSVPYKGEGAMRILYFAILIPHVLLAAVVVPLALLTIYRGWTTRYDRHKKVARITLPVWLYVSLSGVAVYLMLYL